MKSTSRAFRSYPGFGTTVSRDVVPGGTERNLEAVDASVDWPDRFADARKLALADAQTSGGLLLSVPERKAAELKAALTAKGVPVAAEIGRVQPQERISARGDRGLILGTPIDGTMPRMRMHAGPQGYLRGSSGILSTSDFSALAGPQYNANVNRACKSS